MTIHFYLRYHTQLGQSVSLHQNIEGPTKLISSTTIPMQYLNDEFWHVVAEVETGKGLKLNYRYTVTNETGEEIREGEHDRTIDLSKPLADTLECVDAWNF